MCVVRVFGLRARLPLTAACEFGGLAAPAKQLGGQARGAAREQCARQQSAQCNLWRCASPACRRKGNLLLLAISAHFWAPQVSRLGLLVRWPTEWSTGGQRRA